MQRMEKVPGGSQSSLKCCFWEGSSFINSSVLGENSVLASFNDVTHPGGKTLVIALGLCRGRSPGVPQGKGRGQSGGGAAVLGGLCGSLLLFWLG